MIKIKVIDLLNKIANGEEVPQKVSINAGIHGVDTWVYDEHYEDYKNGANIYLLDSGMTTNHLNDEVEIIEEDKKIRKIYTFPGLDDDDYAYEEGNRPNNVKINNKIEELIIDKINEIIEHLNKGE